MHSVSLSSGSGLGLALLCCAAATSLILHAEAFTNIFPHPTRCPTVKNVNRHGGQFNQNTLKLVMTTQQDRPNNGPYTGTPTRSHYTDPSFARRPPKQGADVVVLQQPMSFCKYKLPRVKTALKAELEQQQTLLKQQAAEEEQAREDARNTRQSSYQQDSRPRTNDNRGGGVDTTPRRSSWDSAPRGVERNTVVAQKTLAKPSPGSVVEPARKDLIGRREKDKKRKSDEEAEKRRVAATKGRGGGKAFDDEDEFAPRRQYADAGRMARRTGKTKRKRGNTRERRANEDETTIRVELAEAGTIQVQDLAEKMQIKPADVIKHLMLNKGIMATMTHSIDVGVAREVVNEFDILLSDEYEDEDDDDDEIDDDEEEDHDGEEVHHLIPRAPVVTIMGHVDHGKTSILDAIRNARVAMGEKGGITQHIGSYQVVTKTGHPVTFLDTPGHAAFSEMRARGAKVTDVVVLVVAADDGVMEQTKEAIATTKAAGVPLVVAVNKMDREGADPQRVLTELMSYDVLAEEFGGDVMVSKISARTGEGIDDLLEKILLQTEVLELKANPDAPVEGTVIETRVEKGKGTVASVLVQKGTLHVGELLLVGPAWGKVRAIYNSIGEKVASAGPSEPVQIVGLSGLPLAGDKFVLALDETEARDVAEARQRIARELTAQKSSLQIKGRATALADGSSSSDSREHITIALVVKADVTGSVEALLTSLSSMSKFDESTIVDVAVISSGVGDITKADVALASVAGAKIIAFGVGATNDVVSEARQAAVEIGYYGIVYEVLEELEATLQKTLSPPPPGKLTGRATIKKIFSIGKVGKIAGCECTEGIIKADGKVRVLRGKRNEVFQGQLTALKIFKDEVQEVPEGSECGMSFKDWQDMEEDDIIECFVPEGQLQAEEEDFYA